MNGTLALPGILVQLSHTRLPNVLEKSVGANTPGDDIRTKEAIFPTYISNSKAKMICTITIRLKISKTSVIKSVSEQKVNMGILLLLINCGVKEKCFCRS